MDNVIFNVNGRYKNQLNMALMTRMAQEHFKHSDVEFDIVKLDAIAKNNIKGYFTSEENGLVLCWTEVKNMQGWHPVTFTGVKDLTDFVWNWLQSSEAKYTKMQGWDDDCDHDGHNNLGWRVLVEDWGHVDRRWEAFVAIKPAYLWYGK